MGATGLEADSEADLDAPLDARIVSAGDEDETLAADARHGSLSLGRAAFSVLLGALGAVVGVLVWYLVQYGTKSQMLYLVVGLGAGVGFAVAYGARRGGVVVGAIAVGISALAILVGLYYVDRSTFIRDRAQAGLRLTVPMWPSWDWFWYVIRAGFRQTFSQYIYFVIGLVAAGWYGFRGPHKLDSHS